MSIGSRVEGTLSFLKLPRGLQYMAIVTLLVVGLIVIVGGGGIVYTFINTLILEPIKGGRISALAMIVIGVFFVMIIARYRHRSDDDIIRSEHIEELRGKIQSRRRY